MTRAGRLGRQSRLSRPGCGRLGTRIPEPTARSEGRDQTADEHSGVAHHTSPGVSGTRTTHRPVAFVAASARVAHFG